MVGMKEVQTHTNSNNDGDYFECDGRGRGDHGCYGGGDRTGRGANMSIASRGMQQLPKKLSVFSNSWEEATINSSYKTITLDEYDHLDYGEVMKTTYFNTDSRAVNDLQRKGVKVDIFNIYSHLLFNSVILQIVEYTAEQLVLMGYFRTSMPKFKQFMGFR